MNDLLVLCYHGISDSWPARTTVTPAALEEQLQDFLRQGYRGGTFSEALTAPTAEQTLVVTFDDAHRSVMRIAAPMMARLGIPGTMYVPTDYPGSGKLMSWEGYDAWLGSEYESELECMSWDELRALATAGWEIGSHTRSHPRLPRLGAAELAAELIDSRRACEEQIGAPCRSLAYPYGNYDGRVARAAAEAGYRFAATLPRSPQPPLPLQWPRVGVYHGESARRVRLRARSRRHASMRSARAALAVRRRLSQVGRLGR